MSKTASEKRDLRKVIQSCAGRAVKDVLSDLNAACNRARESSRFENG